MNNIKICQIRNIVILYILFDFFMEIDSALAFTSYERPNAEMVAAWSNFAREASDLHEKGPRQLAPTGENGDGALFQDDIAVERDASLGAVGGPLTFDGGALRWLGRFDINAKRAIALESGGGVFNTGGFDTTVDQPITGSGSLTKMGGGTLTLKGDNSFEGGLVFEDGVVAVSRDRNLGALDGSLTFNGGELYFQNSMVLSEDRTITLLDGGGRIRTKGGKDLNPVTINQPIVGPGKLSKLGAGKLFLNGQNSYSGGTFVGMGKLIGDSTSIRGDLAIARSGTVVFNQHKDGVIAGSVAGQGRIIKRGPATLSFTGDGSRFEGKTDIRRGSFVANGQWGGDIIVRRNATFAGNAAIDARLDIRPGGQHRPGNSIGTTRLRNYTLAEGNTSQFEIGKNGESDLVQVTETATIKKGATLTVDWYGDEGLLHDRYRIITANKIEGTFSDVIDNVDAPFVDLVTTTDSQNVYIETKPNNVPFGQLELSENGAALAKAIDGQHLRDDLYKAIELQRNSQNARLALEGLSTEIYASEITVLLEDDLALHKIASDRIRAAFAVEGSKVETLMSFGPNGREVAPATSSGFSVWGSGVGSWSDFQGDGANVSGIESSTSGLFFGADTAVMDWRVGVFGGFSRSNFSINTKTAHGQSKNYHLGLFGGTKTDHWTFQSGLTFSRHEVSNDRTIAIPGLLEQLSSDYVANAFTLFSEMGYQIDANAIMLEPFVGFEYGHLETHQFSEHGGISAVHASKQSDARSLIKLGLNTNSNVSIGKSDVMVYGTIAWRHVLGDVKSNTLQAFANSGDFVTTGVSFAKNGAFIEAGLDIDVGRDANLAISYNGRMANTMQQHGVNASLRIEF